MFIYAARPGHGSEKESRHCIRVHGTQRVQDRAESAEPAGVTAVDCPHVLVKRTLSLSLKRLDVLPTLQLQHLYGTETQGGEIQAEV